MLFQSSRKLLFTIPLLVPPLTHAQDLHSTIQAMQSAYAGSGSIVALDDHQIVIEPKMPSPLCGLPTDKDGKTDWKFYTFPLASITVQLDAVDEKLIAEDRVFTDPNVAQRYKPGDVGDTTLVVVAGLPGKQFHTLTYDRNKLAELGPGPHSSKEYGQQPDDTEAFGLTFSDPAAAHSFEMALKEAVTLAKAKRVSQ